MRNLLLSPEANTKKTLLFQNSKLFLNLVIVLFVINSIRVWKNITLLVCPSLTSLNRIYSFLVLTKFILRKRKYLALLKSVRHVIKNTFLNTNVLKFRQNCLPQTIYLIRLTSAIHFFLTKILRNLKIWDLNLVIHQFPKLSSFLRNLILPLVILGLTKLKNFFILILVKLSYSIWT